MTAATSISPTGAFLVKDRNDLTLLSRKPDEMPYLYQFGQYKPGIYTLECSRSGAGALAALANMRLLGKQGYRVLMGHAVEMMEMLREHLEPLCRSAERLQLWPGHPLPVYPEGVNRLFSTPWSSFLLRQVDSPASVPVA
jgi:L-2,4-diaminobutyrate decarboxylase